MARSHARPLGLATGLALLAGASLVQLLPRLPGPGLVLALMALGAAAWLLLPAIRALAAFALGAAIGLWAGAQAHAVRIPFDCEGRPVAVSGRVVGFPERVDRAVRFEFAADALDCGDGVRRAARLRLSWYEADVLPEPGQVLSFTAVLKRPHGAMNPGGFDFERSALVQRIAATGYLKSAPVVAPGGGGLQAWRWRFLQGLRDQVGDDSRSGLVAALAVGAQSAIPDDDWDVLRATGTAHLVAISGFHVGMVAGLAALFAWLPYRLFPVLALRIPRPRMAAVLALAAALAYAMVAGWSVPVQRTAAMIGVIALARIASLRFSAGDVLGMALWVVLLWDPLSVLAPGFWLSFVAVGWLMACLGGGMHRPGIVAGFGRAQVVMTIALLPLGAWFFQQGSVVAPLANAIAVPLVTLVLVPVTLLATLLYVLSPMLAAPVIDLAAGLAHLILECLRALAALPHATVPIPEPGPVALLLALAGAAWLLMPRGVPGRALGLLLMLPLLWPPDTAPGAGEFDLHVIDVGQGLSVLVRTKEHALLYDAGAAMPNGLDMGEAAVVPTLTARGLRRLDRLVVSHRDNDHAGGVASVSRAVPAVLEQRSDAPGGPTCIAGERWTWDGVRFEFLHPPADFPYLGNPSSCVLRIAAGEHAALLPGDIPDDIEARLVREQRAALRADVLVVPHHGSASSSSAALLRAVQPSLAIVSAGYRNRFQHPSRAALARYERARIRVLTTPDSGMVGVRIGPLGIRAVTSERALRPRYYHEGS